MTDVDRLAEPPPAMGVQAINAPSIGFDVASAAVSAHSAYQDIQNGAGGLEIGLDLADVATSIAGAISGGMALRSARAASTDEGNFTGAVRSAIHSESSNLIAGNSVGMSSFLSSTGNSLAAASNQASYTAELWNASNFATSMAGGFDMAGGGLLGH